MALTISWLHALVMVGLDIVLKTLLVFVLSRLYHNKTKILQNCESNRYSAMPHLSVCLLVYDHITVLYVVIIMFTACMYMYYIARCGDHASVGCVYLHVYTQTCTRNTLYDSFFYIMFL